MERLSMLQRPGLLFSSRSVGGSAWEGNVICGLKKSFNGVLMSFAVFGDPAAAGICDRYISNLYCCQPELSNVT